MADYKCPWLVASDDGVMWHAMPDVIDSAPSYAGDVLYSCCTAPEQKSWKFIREVDAHRVNCFACLTCSGHYHEPCRGIP